MTEPIIVIEDSDLESNGGKYKLVGKVATEVVEVEGEKVIGGTPTTVYVVSEDQVNSGEFSVSPNTTKVQRVSGRGRSSSRWAIPIMQQAASASAAFTGAYDNVSNIVHHYEPGRRGFTSYTGNLVDVYRDSDGAILAFGYTDNGELDKAAITTWLAGANPYVDKVYDQIGSDHITFADRPALVLNGQNGHAVLDFNGTSNYGQEAFAVALSQPYSFYIAGQLEDNSAVFNGFDQFIDGDDASRFMTVGRRAFSVVSGEYYARWRINFGTLAQGRFSDAMFNVWSVLASGATSHFRINGIGLGDISAGTQNADGITLGGNYAQNPVTFLDGTIGAISIADPGHNSTQEEAMEQIMINRWDTLPDITYPSGVSLVGFGTDAQVHTHGVRVFGSGQYAVTADWYGNKVDCWDVSTPSAPTILSTVTGITEATYVFIDDLEQYAFSVGSNVSPTPRFYIIDISNPNAISVTGSVAHANFSGGQQIVIKGNYAWVASPLTDSITVVDITTKSAPSVVTSISGAGAPNYLNYATHLCFSADGNTLFAAGSSDARISAYDISTPTTISLVGSIGTNLNSPHEVVYDNGYLYVANIINDTEGSVVIFNVSNPASMSYATRIYMDSASPGNTLCLAYAHGLALSGNNLYVVSTIKIPYPDLNPWGSALTKIDVTDPTNPSVIWSFPAYPYLFGAHDMDIYGQYLFVASHGAAGLAILQDTNL